MAIAAFLTKLVDLDIMERLTYASNDFGFRLEPALQNVGMSTFCSMMDGFIGRNKDYSLIHLTHNCCFESMEKRGLSLSLPHILTWVFKTYSRAHFFVLNITYYLTGTEEIQPYLILQQLKSTQHNRSFWHAWMSIRIDGDANRTCIHGVVRTQTTVREDPVKMEKVMGIGNGTDGNE